MMIIDRDLPIRTDDGIILRADVFRPDNSSQEPAPVVMVMGPYGKGVDYKEGYAAQWNWVMKEHPDLLPGSTKSYMTWETVDPELWTGWGYSCVRVDSRGTGRSPGKLNIFSPREVRDYAEAIEWAGTQPWSNGKVGLCGISYYAINQWQVAALQPPHLTAMIPWEGAIDAYRDWHRHGGILSNAFTESWYLKQVVGNQHGNPNGWDDHWLGEKATGPCTLSEDELLANRTNPTEEACNHPLDDQWYADRTPDPAKIKVPFLSASNWGGIGLHGRGNFEGFTQSASEQKWLEIHSGRHDEGFYLNDAMSLQRRFFDYFLKGISNGWEKEPQVMLQLRRPENPFGSIRKEHTWPLHDTNWTKMSLSAPEVSIKQESVPGTKGNVTFDARAGETIFLSAPLDKETEITGPLAAKLFISSSTSDADIFLTLQAFSPEGKEVEFQGGWDPHTPLGQGWLRASHRKLDNVLTKPYRPFHTHDESQPLEPGVVYPIEVEIWPTHIILPIGYRIALMVAGRDFQRPAALADESLTWRNKGSGPFLHTHRADRGSDVFAGNTTIHTGEDTDSYVYLPIISREANRSM